VSPGVELLYSGEGERLDRFVAGQLEGTSRAAIQQWIKAGDVTVNGQHAKSSLRLAAGDIVRVIWPDASPPEVEPVPMALSIIYEDRDCVVIDKPPGLVVHPATSHQRDTLVSGLLARFPDMASMVDTKAADGMRPGIVHRLDKDTSGLIVVARNEASRRALQRQFRTRSVEKTYQALVYGRLAESEGRIVASLGRDPRHRHRIAVLSGGREAVTEYQVLQYLRTPHGNRELYTLVEARLLTGRTHQIRVHLAYVGHPVVGDLVYGRRKKRIACPRQFLHACRLAFHHPADGRWVVFQSPLPEDLQQVLTQLEQVG
jgi:23S rRNA pseudouridine1911/1915/1917 synthase